MTTRRDFLKTLGAGAAVAAVPITVGQAIANAEAKSRLQIGPLRPWDKPEYPRLVGLRWPVTANDVKLRLLGGHAARVKANDIILNINTREQLLVSTIVGDSLIVHRGLHSFPYAIETTDKLLLIASAFGEV